MPALDHVGKQECRDEGENNAEDGDTESEDWGPSQGEWSGCEEEGASLA
jgi:hypothetical protein